MNIVIIRKNSKQGRSRECQKMKRGENERRNGVMNVDL